VTNESIIFQLTEIYLNEETYYKEKMSKEEADEHHRRMLNSGQIITVSDGDNLIGYVEFSTDHGCCFINDLFIRPAHRRSKVIWMLKKRLFEVCGKCTVYFGERNKHDNRYPESQLRRIYGQ